MSISVPSPTLERWNPSYPQRTHTFEALRWRTQLAEWEARVAAAVENLVARGDPKSQRLRVQLLGAIDQLSDCVKRLPLEAGVLFREDEHRLAQAVCALERLTSRD